MKNKTLWLMVGIPGSGKSYIAKHLLMRGNGWRYISRDEVRSEFLKDDEDNFAHEFEVFNVFTDKVEQTLMDGEVTDVIVDATHLHWPSRRKLLRGIGQINPTINIIPVVIVCDPDIAYERNLSRTGRAQVPPEPFFSMVKAFKHPKDDPFKYTAIMEVYNDGNH